MNDRDFDQVLNAFLDLGPETAPDRVAAAARHEARETRQTLLPSWWPSWRFPIMNSTVRYGIAAVAVIVVALVGINYLAPNVGSPGPIASATPEPSPTPATTVDPSAQCIAVNPDEALAIDRYCLDVPAPLEIMFDIPNIGWEPYVPADDHAALLNGNSWGLTFMEVENVYVDPCRTGAGLLDPPLGPTVDDLLTRLREQTGFEISNDTEVAIGGYTGQQLEIAVADDATGCSDGGTWGIPPSGFEGPGGTMVPTPDRPVWVWVGDVDGTRLVITRPLSALPSPAEWASGIRDTNRHAADLLELDAIVESLRFNQ